jgi:hypothetical protein
MVQARYYVAFDSPLGRWYWNGEDFKLGFQYAEIYPESQFLYVLNLAATFYDCEATVFYAKLQPAEF